MKNKKEVINYLVFGILTTLVNIISYALFTKTLKVDYKMSTTIAWLISVIFAFVTNKFYVFDSKSLQIGTLTKEFLSFGFFRLLSYIIDISLMVILIECSNVDDLYAKILANILVVIINYFASKWFIFKKDR